MIINISKRERVSTILCYLYKKFDDEIVEVFGNDCCNIKWIAS
jgi:hypothetical protein